MAHPTKNHGDHNEDPRDLSAKQFKQKIDRAMLTTTIASTVIAVVAAAAAVWSGYEAHETRVNDERPFIAVDVSDVSKYDTFDTKIVAFGKTPARRISLACAHVPNNDSEDTMWQPTQSYTHLAFPYLLPGRSISVSCWIQPGTGPELTEFGVLSYYDDRESYYQTPFCFHITRFVNALSKIQTCTKTHGLPELK